MTVFPQHLCVFQCDACGNSITLKGLTAEDTALVPPWRYVQIKGWAGTFHACSDFCEKSLRAKHV